jgi:hypothetical protein
MVLADNGLRLVPAHLERPPRCRYPTQLITGLTPTPNCAAADGADVINISSGQLTPAGEAQRILADAVRSCSRADKLIVAKPSPRRQPWSADNGGKSFGIAKDDYKLGGGRDNCRNYLLRPVIGAVEMSKIERHPHKVGNSARLHLLHDRGPVMLGRPRADP